MKGCHALQTRINPAGIVIPNDVSIWGALGNVDSKKNYAECNKQFF